jgi:hypothetical protein
MSYQLDERRHRRKKIPFGESQNDRVELTGRDDFCVNTFNVILDRLLCELLRRLDGYREVNQRYKVSYLVCS